MLCNKTDKPLVVYRFSGKFITSIISLRIRWQKLDVYMPKLQFIINLSSCDK